MRRIKSNYNNIISALFFIYLLSAILEKFKWDIFGWGCDIFTILTAIIFVCLLIHCISANVKIRFSKIFSFVLFYYVALLIYMPIQFCFIEHSTIINTQFLKGVVTNLLQIVTIINFAILISLLGKDFTFEYFMRMLYYITIVNTIYCLIQNIYPEIDELLVRTFHSDVTRWGVDSYGAFGRVTGLLLESNFNGAFLLIGFINEIGLIIKNKQRKQKIKTSLIFFTLLTFIEFILTFSRTAYLGFLVVAVYFFVKSSRKIRRKMMACIAIVGCCAIVLFFANKTFQEIIRARFSFLFGTSQLSDDSHFKILIEALQIFFKDLNTVFFGVGTNCLSDFYSSMFGYSMMKAHNYYVQILCEVGICGFALLMFYLCSLWSVARKGKGLDSLIYKMIFIATIFTNFTYDPLCRNYNVILCIGAIAIEIVRNREISKGVAYGNNICYAR